MADQPMHGGPAREGQEAFPHSAGEIKTGHDPKTASTVLIHNFFNYGHFLVYADNITRWALSRGHRVALMGMELQETAYARTYAHDPRVSLLDDPVWTSLSQDRAGAVKKCMMEETKSRITQMQRDLDPAVTFLLTADDFLYEDVPFPDFPTPTAALVTFGHRDHYQGYKDLYTRRLDRVIKARRPFSSVLTLDEHHAFQVDPQGEHVLFLPDMYALASETPDDSPDAHALRAFMDSRTGPVIPLLGKFDRRKNAIWVLRAVLETPGLSAVVLGERLPCPEDEAIVDILTRLVSQGRVFIRWGFVSESLFHITLGHPATSFLPLPYIRHYGSSGPQLMGLAHGKPCLAPDNGLMGRRVAGNNLGEVFSYGNEEAFRQGFSTMLAKGPAPYADSIRAFMAGFGRESLHDQLDRAAGTGRGGPPHFPWPDGKPKDGALAPLHQGLDLLLAGNARKALDLLDTVLAGNTSSLTGLWAKVLTLDALENFDGRDDAMRLCLELGGIEEADFYVENMAREYFERLGPDGPNTSARRTVRLLSLVCPQPPGTLPHVIEAWRGSMLPDLMARMVETLRMAPDCWQNIGVILAQAGAYDAAVLAFREAFRLAPGEFEFLLNLSDVQRYAKRYAQSAQALNELEARAGDHPGLHHKRGQILFETGRFEEAMSQFLQEPEDSKFHDAARVYMERIAAKPEPVSGAGPNPAGPSSTPE